MSDYICITGVSSGLGRHASTHLINEGYHVIGTVRNRKDAFDLQESYPHNFTAFVLDVTNDIEVDAFANFVTECTSGKGLKALVNNAGLVVAGPLMHITTEELRHQMDVNLLGVHRVTRALFPSLLKCQDSRIINMGSISGLIANAFLGPYCASKFALEAYTDSLRRELGIYDIKVVLLEPGTIKTPIWNKSRGIESKYEDTDYASILRHASKIIDRSENHALDPIHVSRAILHAIRAKSVKTRYVIARHGWRYRVISHLVPDKLLDRLFQRFALKRHQVVD